MAAVVGYSVGVVTLPIVPVLVGALAASRSFAGAERRRVEAVTGRELPPHGYRRSKATGFTAGCTHRATHMARSGIRQTVGTARSRDRAPRRSSSAKRSMKVGLTPRLSDAELVTLAVMQALLGFTSEARRLRHAGSHLRQLFPYLSGQSGWNKRLRHAGELVRHVIGVLAADTTWWSDDVGRSTPPQRSGVVPGRPRNARTRPDGPNTAAAHTTGATSGDCDLTGSARCTACPWRSPSPAPRPTNAPPCSTCSAAHDPDLLAARPGQVLIADRHHYGRDFERGLADRGGRVSRSHRCM
ncbi:hypothetical protein GT354_23675 [Streptomyces sp. SID3343]|nr:hypothetical protein [Streptomyces sp. SID3343]